MTVFKNNIICLALIVFMLSVCVLFFFGTSSLTAGEHPEESQDSPQDPANTPDSHEKQLLFETNGLPENIFKQTPDIPKQASSLTLSGIAQVRATMDTRDDDRQENNTSLRNRIILESRYKKNARVSVLYDYLYFGDDNLDIVIGANLFYGDDDTWLGRFNNDSQFFVDVSYHF